MYKNTIYSKRIWVRSSSLAVCRVVQMAVELGFGVKCSLTSCTLIRSQWHFLFSILAVDYMKILLRLLHLLGNVCLVQGHDKLC